MRIGLDIDGVLEDWAGHVLTTVNHAFDKNVKLVDVDFEKNYSTMGLFEDKKTMDNFLLSQRTWWQDIPTLPGAIGAVFGLIFDGHTLELITNRPEYTSIQTRASVLEWWPGFTQPIISHVPDIKTVIDVQVYVDDNHERLAEIVARERKAYGVRQPWNKKHEVALAKAGVVWLDSIADLAGEL